MKSKKIISLVLLVLIILTTGGILYTNSKYATSVEGNISYDVAKYSFNISAQNASGERQDLTNFILTDTSNNSNVVDGKIAPGTSGEFDIVVDATGSDVAIDYIVSFENTTGESLPTNFKMKLDGEEWSFDSCIIGKFGSSGPKSRSYHITWEWPYETKDAGNSIAAGDLADTLDGQKALNYSFKVIAVGTQSKPL